MNFPGLPKPEDCQSVDDSYEGPNRKGYISTEFTVWCGLCHNMEQVSAFSKRDAAKQVKEHGWRMTRKHGWLCDEHK